MNSTKRSRAFTLIELLVVVAIIALLISILLPSLSRAKEQARIAVCLSNFKSMGTAANAYLLEDTSADMPWSLPFGYEVGSQRYPFGFSSECIYGGGMPDTRPNQWPGWAPAALDSPIGTGPGQTADVYLVPPRYRPMNKYFAPSVSWDNGNRDDWRIARRQIPMDLPGFFQCPSDTTPWVPLQGNSATGGGNPIQVETETPEPMWKWWGTSYPINWYWPRYYMLAPPGDAAPYNGSFGSILGNNSNVKGLGDRMLAGNNAGGWESRFIIFYEGLFNYAMQGAEPRGSSNPDARQFVGWHRQLNNHAAGYRDGHADYGLRDTRFVDGETWTTWPNRPWGGGWAQYNDN